MGIDPAAVPVFEVITGGAVVDGNAAGVDLTAAALAISAGATVGTAADPLDTAAGSLEVLAAGGVFVTDSGPALTVGGVLPTLAGVQAGGAVQITASAGPLAVQEAVVTTSGAVTLTAGGAGGLLTVAAAVNSAADVGLVADEIDLTGGAGSVSGPGHGPPRHGHARDHRRRRREYAGRPVTDRRRPGRPRAPGPAGRRPGLYRATSTRLVRQ